MEASAITVRETVPASRKLQAEDARELLSGASRLITVKGKKVHSFAANELAGADAVAAMLGPTGNLRAPTARIGNTVVVGFNEDVYRQALG